MKPWVVVDGNTIACASCGYTDSYDGWTGEEWKQFKKESK